LYDKFIDPIADTYAWVLMPNHLHYLVRIKETICYKYTDAGSMSKDRFNEVKWQTIDLPPKNGTLPSIKNAEHIKRPVPGKHFSHLLNAYAKYFNIESQSGGTLFERPFKRKHVDNLEYLKRLIIYIHNNPVHHGFCEHPIEYPWSSYLSCISLKPTKLKRDKVIGWFDGEANFITKHGEKMDFRDLEGWLEI
jgi:REP element-mobilizing transposase RayT